MYNKTILYLLFFAAASVAAPEHAAPRIGDPESVFDEALFDERFPLQREWARAGVEGGVPHRDQNPVVAHIKAGMPIQPALDAAAKDGGGVVLLLPGEHRVETALIMRSDVILRGSGRELTLLTYGRNRSQDDANAVNFSKVQHAGLEDLTIVNPANVDGVERSRGIYRGGFGIGDDPAAVEMHGAINCWVQNCDILASLTSPIRIRRASRHITLRDNRVWGAIAKGGKGNGYYGIEGAAYVLMYNEDVRDIRHVCLQGMIGPSVMIHCRVTVDVNWHGGKPMNGFLVEAVTSYLPTWHFWPPVAHYRASAGTNNYLYRHEAWFRGAARPPDAGLYTLAQSWQTEPDWLIPITPEPRGGTMYPVTGRHTDDPAELAARAVYREYMMLQAGQGRTIPQDAAKHLQQIAEQYPDTQSGYVAQTELALLTLQKAEKEKQATLDQLQKSPGYADLEAARAMLNHLQLDQGTKEIREIIKKYPDTPVANEAEKILRSMRVPVEN